MERQIDRVIAGDRERLPLLSVFSFFLSLSLPLSFSLAVIRSVSLLLQLYEDRLVILFGGSDGSKTLNDLYELNLGKKEIERERERRERERERGYKDTILICFSSFFFFLQRR
jgi:hypothetical protein